MDDSVYTGEGLQGFYRFPANEPVTTNYIRLFPVFQAGLFKGAVKLSVPKSYSGTVEIKTSLFNGKDSTPCIVDGPATKLAFAGIPHY